MNQRISWMLALTAAGMPARVPRSVRLPRAGKAAARMQRPASKHSSNSKRPRSSSKPNSAGPAPHASKAAGIPSNSPDLACAGNACTSLRADIDRMTVINMNGKKNMNKTRLLHLLVVCTTLFVSACQTSAQAPEKENLSNAEVLERRQQILDMSKLALEKLHAENPAAKAEIQAAHGYAVFDVSTVNALVLVGARGKGIVVDNKTGKRTFMRTTRGGTGPGIGYQRLYQVFVFKSEAALAQFKLGDKGGADVSGSATLGTSGKQYSLNPNITVYQVSDKGYAVQANWGGTAYLVDPDLN